MTAAVLAVLGYVAGRLHGHSRHKRFVARGFRLMAKAARRDKVGARSIHDHVVRPADVSNAFGEQNELAMTSIAVTHPIEVKP